MAVATLVTGPSRARSPDRKACGLGGGGRAEPLPVAWTLRGRDRRSSSVALKSCLARQRRHAAVPVSDVAQLSEPSRSQR
jgi:hypothetical protein